MLNVRDLPERQARDVIVTNIHNQGENRDVESGGENDAGCCSNCKNCCKTCLLIPYTLFWSLVYFIGITVVIAISPIVIVFLIIVFSVCTTGNTFQILKRDGYCEWREVWDSCKTHTEDVLSDWKDYLYRCFNCLDLRYDREGCLNFLNAVYKRTVSFVYVATCIFSTFCTIITFLFLQLICPIIFLFWCCWCCYTKAYA